jgi:hypothetical protein
MKKNLVKWAALMLGGATVLQSGGFGCLNTVWDGFWNTGWPTENRWLNLGIDILNEELFS